MPNLSSRTPRTFAGLLVASATLVLSVTACSGGSGATTAAAGGTGNPGGRNTQFQAYTECLQKNGVTIAMPSGMPRNRPSGGAGYPSGMPRPSRSPGERAGGQRGGSFPGGGGFGKPADVSQEVWDKAQAACASVMPSFGAGRGNRGNGADTAYRNCLRQNGVPAGGGLNSTDPTVKKAEQKCAVLRPTAGASPTA